MRSPPKALTSHPTLRYPGSHRGPGNCSGSGSAQGPGRPLSPTVSADPRLVGLSQPVSYDLGQSKIPGTSNGLGVGLPGSTLFPNCQRPLARPRLIQRLPLVLYECTLSLMFPQPISRMPVALPADPSLRPRAQRPRSACHQAVRCTSESRHPADQEFLLRNSSNRHPADSQRWPLATDHWQLLAGASPPAPRPAHRPLARSPQPACHPAVRRPAVRTWPQPSPFVIRDAQRGGLTTRTKHGQHASRDLPRNSSAHRQPADSPPRQPAPGDGQPPTGTDPSVLSPAHRPLARRPQVARADPRSQLRTTPPNSGRPAAPRARTPARRLTPQPGPKPPPRRPNPSPR